jgi:hypothetical protein
MALTRKEAEIASKQKKKERRGEVQDNKRRALSYLKSAVKDAEKAIDKEIREGRTSIIISSGDMHSAGASWRSWLSMDYHNKIDLVFKYANNELAKILREKYLSKGWASLTISNGYIELR